MGTEDLGRVAGAARSQSFDLWLAEVLQCAVNCSPSPLMLRTAPIYGEQPELAACNTLELRSPAACVAPDWLIAVAP